MHRMLLRIASGAVFSLLLVTIVGCGSPPMGPVKGKVTFHGTPITRGVISFIPAQGAPYPAAIVDGVYETEAIPIGEYRLTVSINTVPGAPTTSKAGANKATVLGEGLGAADTAPPPKKAAAAPLDEKYSTPDGSGLKFTVQAGPNTYDPPDLK